MAADEYIHFLPSILFSWAFLIFGPKVAENPKILSIMAAQGLENTVKVKVIHFKRSPDNSGDDIYISCLVLYCS